MNSKEKFVKQALKEFKKRMYASEVALTEMNFAYSENEILRVFYKSIKEPFSHKWCELSNLPSQVDKKIEKALGTYISNDGQDYHAIIKVLRAELPTNQDELIENIKFGESDDDTISPIQKLEFSLTVKELCDMIGIG